MKKKNRNQFRAFKLYFLSEIVILFMFYVYSWENEEKLMFFRFSVSVTAKVKNVHKSKKRDFNGKHNVTIDLKIEDEEEFNLIFKLVPLIP